MSNRQSTQKPRSDMTSEKCLANHLKCLANHLTPRSDMTSPEKSHQSFRFSPRSRRWHRWQGDSLALKWVDLNG